VDIGEQAEMMGVEGGVTEDKGKADREKMCGR
jgi:hypothetical protein